MTLDVAKLNLRMALAPGISRAVIGESLEYLSENELLMNGFGFPVEELKIYDPDTEIVVVVIWPGGETSICRAGLLPEHFLQAGDQ